MTAFVPGLRLSELFFREAVRPVLSVRRPRLKYSAGLLGWGSDALGYDTPRSMDHMWGPRLLLFVGEEDYRAARQDLVEELRWNLPRVFRGFSVHFGSPDAAGVRRAESKPDGPVEHMVEVFTPASFLKRYLGIESASRLKPVDWLSFREQSLLEVTGGGIFHDGLGQMNALRRRLRYYPRDVWLHRLATAWQELADEEAFPGRCHELGDEIGCRVLLARQAERVIRLCFLLERRYAPYSKWLGTAFARLRVGRTIGPLLLSALSSRRWESREASLAKACEAIARKHNRLGITPPQPAVVTRYFGRPYWVIGGDRFAQATAEEIRDPRIRNRTRVKRH